MIDIFARDILDGLTAAPKRLPSKYFYDKDGDQLFQRIMKLPEYYLTACEHEILSDRKDSLLKLFTAGGKSFNLVEFGAGDGYKTKVLLKHFLAEGADFDYVPIDISSNVLAVLQSNLASELPDLNVRPLQTDYFNALQTLRNGGKRNVILFLGSNIGNFSPDQAYDFLEKIYSSMKREDMLLVGFDLKKEPEIILAAYNDSSGVTRDFNLNLLKRINRELAGNIDVSSFIHYPVYNPQTGTAKSYLVSKVAQAFEVSGVKIELEAWEAIHTEVSQKFSVNEITRLSHLSGFTELANYYDSRRYFVDSVWKK